MTVIIPSGRAPLRLMIMATLVVYGVASLLAYDRVTSGSAVRQFPEPWGRVFLATIATGGAVVLLAAWRNSVMTTLTAERSGLILIGLMAFIYAGWSLYITGLGAIGFMAMLTAVGTDAALRVAEIEHARRAAREARP